VEDLTLGQPAGRVDLGDRLLVLVLSSSGPGKKWIIP
jgi:hypothetical protein